MLKSRLYEMELQKREEAANAQSASKTDIGWGHQIRSYVLAPYQMVKDLRTSVETGNPDAVLDGELDAFMAAALAMRRGNPLGGKCQRAVGRGCLVRSVTRDGKKGGLLAGTRLFSCL